MDTNEEPPGLPLSSETKTRCVERGDSCIVVGISWIKDKSLADLDNLPDPDVLANDIITDFRGTI
jgi:hypothetical protein